MQDILCERRTSNKLIDEAMSDARTLSRQAVQMMNDATAKTVQADQLIIAERARASAYIREERAYQSSQAKLLHKQNQDILNKHQK